jgi:hypothetical protein
MATNTPGQEAIDAIGKPINLGDYCSIAAVITSTSGYGSDGTVDATTLGSSTMITVEGSDCGAAAYTAQSAQAPNQPLTPQVLALDGLPVATATLDIGGVDQVTVLGQVTAISSVNGAYGTFAAVTVVTLGSSTTLVLRGSDIYATTQTL